MKKTFSLSHPKIKYARMIDAAKHDVKKYIKRERNKKLPKDVDFWDFDCKYGNTEQDAKVIHQAEINQYIAEAEKQQLESFYLEVVAKPGYRTYKPTPEVDETDFEDESEEDFGFDSAESVDEAESADNTEASSEAEGADNTEDSNESKD